MNLLFSSPSYRTHLRGSIILTKAIQAPLKIKYLCINSNYVIQLGLMYPLYTSDLFL
jgi:hypothetical protein